MPTDANGAPGYAGSGGYGPSSPDGIPTEPGGGPGNDGSGYGQPPPDRTPPEYGGYPGDGGAPGYGPDGRPEGGPTLSDAQIVGILHVVNQGEVLAGQQAQRKAEDPMVRDFANRLVAEHAALDEQLLGLASQFGVSPEPSRFTDKLEAVKGHVLAKLERFSGPAYDVAYIDTQLAGHGGLVALLDFLGTKAVNPALRDAIRAARPLVLSQLEQATAVREQLQDL
jgi:putative membrane protein